MKILKRKTAWICMLIMCVIFLIQPVRANSAVVETWLQIPDGYVLNPRVRATSADKKIALNVGDEILWGGYAARQYWLDDGSTVFCLEPLKMIPDPGEHTITEVRDNNDLLTKALYYLYGGPGFADAGLSTGDSAVDYSISHYTASYIFDGCKDEGDGNVFALLEYSAIAQIQEWFGKIQTMPSPPEDTCSLIFDTGNNSETGEKSQIMGLLAWKESKGSIELHKSSGNPQMTEGNDCYSLSGASYGIFYKGTDNQAGTIVTDANGYGKADNIPAGDYDIKELTAPKGYALSSDAEAITVSANGTAVGNYTDKPQNNPVTILFGKVDAETNNNKPPENRSLENAEFTAKFYKGHYTANPAASGVQPERTWVLKTKQDGFASLEETCKVSGDDFYYTSDGKTTLPLGTITIQETKAPKGYLLNEEVFVRQITSEGSAEVVNTYTLPAVPEQTQKGVIRLNKVDAQTNGKPSAGGSLQGAVYEIFDSQGTTVDTVTTNEDGEAQSRQIPVGTYTVKEKTPSSGYILDTDTYTITFEGDTLSTPVFYKDITSRETPQKGIIRLQKQDKETDGLPAGDGSLEGAGYEVFNSKNEKMDTLLTDAQGKAQSKPLPLGTYTVKEYEASRGYMKDPAAYTVILAPDQSNAAIVYGDVLSKETPQKGIIKLKKGDYDTGKGEPQGKASLQGAVYEIFNNSSQVVDTLITDEQGKAQSKELLLGTYTIKEKTPSQGYNLDPAAYTVKLTSENRTERVMYKTAECKEKIIRGGIALEKWDSEKEKREPQGMADFEKTKIQIISENENSVMVEGKIYEKGDVITTLLTDAEGRAATGSDYLPYGDYQLKETVPPTGYSSSGTITRKFSIREQGKILQMNTADTAIKNKVIRGGVLVEKWDIEMNKPYPQGAACLEGAEIQIISKNTNTVLVDGKEFKEDDVITTLVTDKKGKAGTKTDYLPYGNYLLKEVVPPAGYNNTGKIARNFSIRNQGETVKMDTSDTAVKNEVIRGDVQIVKFGADQEGKDKDIKKPLKDVKFIFTSKTTGEKYTIVTDENGYAGTQQLGNPRGGLVYDTYVVTEESPYADYAEIQPFEVTIYEERKTFYYIIENGVIEAPVSVVKKDAATGRVIPAAGTCFQILDEDKNVIEMTVSHYPSLIVQDTWETDDTGSFMFPEKLKPGTYYLRETKAPKGYLKGKLLEFKVDDSHQWDKPVVVEYKDVPVKGNIIIHKSDKVTGEKLQGAVFAIYAAEDIITPDGTIRAVKGETVDIITTDKDGKAVSEKLFPGKYKVKEKKPAPGFVLSEKSYKAELKYKDQTTELVTDTLEIKNKPTVIIIDKKAADSEQRLSGVKFAVWNKAMTEGIDPGIAQKTIYTTAKNGEIRIERLLPGTYCIQEQEGLAGYAMDDAVHEITVDEKGKIRGKGSRRVVVENAKTEIVSTKAVSMDTGGHEAAGKKDTVITDKILFKNLQSGAEVRIQGILMDKDTGEPLLIGEKQVTAETVFKAEKGEQEVENVFRFDASALTGKEVVVFEKAFIGEIEIAAHEDMEDKAQTVKFPTPKIGTTAENKTTGTREAAPNKETTIVDKVKYENLIPGQEYTVKGVLMDKETGKELLIDGNPVTAEKTFIAKKKEGSEEIVFTFDARTLTGKIIVVFEHLYIEENQVAVHADMKDKNQTIEFPVPEIRTTAKDKDTGTQESAAKEKTVITDTVFYENLIPDQEYMVKGILMDKSTGKELLIAGKPVKAEKTFTPKEKNGSVELEFVFDGRDLKGQAVVVFERLYVDETEVAAHTDIEDQGQTVKIKEIEKPAVLMPKPPRKEKPEILKAEIKKDQIKKTQIEKPEITKTGDKTPIGMFLMAAAGSLSIIFGIMAKKKGR